MYLQFNEKKGKKDKVYYSVLLCEKYREHGAVKTRVVLNLSKLPNETITALKAVYEVSTYIHVSHKLSYKTLIFPYF